MQSDGTARRRSDRLPDPLTADEVAELTGYHRRTILRYVQRKYIYAVNIMGKDYISKHSIINYLATG